MKTAEQWIVLWDDGQGLCAPMGWDHECDGALCLADNIVAIFESRKAARKAIDISEKFARLKLAQGAIANEDFIGDGRKCIRILPCRPLTQSAAQLEK